VIRSNAVGLSAPRYGGWGQTLVSADNHGAGKDALAGIFIFDVPSLEEAEALARMDPAVQAGRFTVEVMPWFGPAGLTYDGRVPADPNARCD